MNRMSSIMSMTLYSADSLVFVNNAGTTCHRWSHRLQSFIGKVRKIFLEVFSPFCYNNQNYTKQSGFPFQGSLLGWPLSLWSLQITVQFTPCYCSLMETLLCKQLFYIIYFLSSITSTINAPRFTHPYCGMNPEFVFVLVPTLQTLKYTPLQFCIQTQDCGLALKGKKHLVQ